MSESKVTKRYVCNRYPNFAMSGGIKFSRGVFVTSDPVQKETIESNDWFGVFIFDGGEVEDDQEGKGRVPPVQPVETGKGARSSKVERGGSEEQGRKTSSIFQETEEIVKASGILDKKDYPTPVAVDPKRGNK